MAFKQIKKPLWAALLSLVVAGLGQAYNRELRKAVILGASVPLFLLVLAGSNLLLSFVGFAFTVSFQVGFRLFVIIDAWRGARKPESDQPKRTSRWAIYFCLALLAVGTGLAWETILGMRAFRIPSSAMEPTILVGDHVEVNLRAYQRAVPQRGDIVAFKYPVDPSVNYIKRVVGVPGDRLRLVEKQLYVNGQLADEGYKMHQTATVDEFRDNFPSGEPTAAYPAWADALPNHLQNGWLVMPPGHYFVMGDNRDFSSDSRYWGFVPRENIIGKPLYIYWARSRERIGRRLGP